MNFPVPWRALLPSDAVTAVGGAARDICNATGAGVDISADGETPPTLSDKICTISGSVEQKEAASRRCVDKLRELQEVTDQEPGVFVIIVPSCAAPVVVGAKGAQIKEVIELSGAEISVGKENIIGTADVPIGITGTGGQVVSAVSKINAILQDLADRGRLQPSDFKYRPGAQASVLSMGDGGAPRGPPPQSGNPRTHAKFVVATQVAGWIIGKQGRHIRELQENSGAHLQILREGEVPPGVSTTDRIIEIGGRFDAKAEGIQIVLMAIDSMPALQGPRETQMLIPKMLTSASHVKDLQSMSGAEMEVRDLPGHDEALCTVLGSIEARIKAAQHILTKLEEAIEGGVDIPVSTMRQTPPPQPAPAATPVQPYSREVPSRQESATSQSQSDPWMQADPWSQGRSGIQPAPAPKSVTFNDPEVVGSRPMVTAQEPRSRDSSADARGGGFASGLAHTSFTPDGPARSGLATGGPANTAAPAARTEASAGGQTSFSPSPAPQHDRAGGAAPAGASLSRARPDEYGSLGAAGGSGMQMSFSPDPARGLTGGLEKSFSPNPAAQHTNGGMAGTSFSPSPAPGGPSGCGGMQTSFSPNGQQGGGCGQTSFGPGSLSFSPDGPAPGHGQGQTSFTPGGAGTPSQTSFGPMGMGAVGMGMGGLGGMGAMTPLGGMGSGMDLTSGMFGMLGGMAANEAMFRNVLQNSAMNGPQAQLVVLLPAESLQKVLIPQGHLAQIAERCQVRIDLGRDVAPNMRQATVSGSIAANAMAAYFLQERCVQACGK